MPSLSIRKPVFASEPSPGSKVMTGSEKPSYSSENGQYIWSPDALRDSIYSSADVDAFVLPRYSEIRSLRGLD